MYACVYVFMYACIYVRMCMYVYVCMFACMYVRMYVCMSEQTSTTQALINVTAQDKSPILLAIIEVDA